MMFLDAITRGLECHETVMNRNFQSSQLPPQVAVALSFQLRPPFPISLSLYCFAHPWLRDLPRSMCARYLAVDIGINEHAAATRPRTWRFRYTPPSRLLKITRNNSLSGATQPEAVVPGERLICRALFFCQTGLLLPRRARRQ